MKLTSTNRYLRDPNVRETMVTRSVATSSHRDRGNSDSIWAPTAQSEKPQEHRYWEEVLAADRRVRLMTARNTAVIGA